MKKDTPVILTIIVICLFAVVGIYIGMRPKTPITAIPDALNDTKVTTTNNDGAVTNTVSSTTKPMDSNTGALEKGKAFLAKNKTESGVMTTASGLQYKVIKEGTGPKPTMSQTVKVNYEGSLIDGTIFDSSYQRGEPIEFGVTQVIAGWTEGLQLMSVGSIYMFYIPSELAYGPRGAGGLIGPNETLIFKVELLGAH